MRAKLRCRGCENGREQPRNRLCPTCRAIVREQQEARARQEKARKAPLTLHELTIVLQSLKALRGDGPTA